VFQQSAKFISHLTAVFLALWANVTYSGFTQMRKQIGKPNLLSDNNLPLLLDGRLQYQNNIAYGT